MTPGVITIIPVSYTHLDVYKRQNSTPDVLFAMKRFFYFYWDHGIKMEVNICESVCEAPILGELY